MNRMIFAFKVFSKIMNLGMTVMARSNAIIGSSIHDLVKFHLPVLTPGISVPGLQISAAAATTVIVGLVGMHVNKIFFSHNGLYNIAQIIRHWISKAFAHNLAWILNRKFDLQILVPIGIDLEFSLPDPFGIILVDACNLKIMGYIKFFQSCQD
jgi:hypothetical protein